MNVNEAIMKRRSIRSFKSDAVERAKLEEILQAGAYAPSALNNQNRQLIAITDSRILKRINDAVENAVDKETKERILSRAQDGKFNFFYNAPVLILVCCDEKERYPQEDCACALENMFLSAYSLGLGTCWINQLSALSRTETIRALLEEMGMKKGYAVNGCCALGYSAVEGKLSKAKTNDIKII